MRVETASLLAVTSVAGAMVSGWVFAKLDRTFADRV